LYYTNVFQTPICEEDLYIQIENGIEVGARIEDNRNKPIIEDFQSLLVKAKTISCNNWLCKLNCQILNKKA
ncbi:MAG: hypothetical protein PHS04_13735, partial [Tissierellia bacterium]|nr:hypothetical protein [Tissierellia bacterium]